jgi:hypothetical protein
MYRREVRVARGLYRSGPRSTRIFGLSGGRVRFIAVADPAVARDRRKLQRHLQLSRR